MAEDESRVRLILRRGFDVFAVAAEAVVSGAATDEHWEVLRALSERCGLERVAHELAVRVGPSGPSARWWSCQLQLRARPSLEATARLCAELAELEVSGRGPRYDLDRHALEVSAAVRYLQTYLDRLRRDATTALERSAASMIVHCVRVARSISRGAGPT